MNPSISDVTICVEGWGAVSGLCRAYELGMMDYRKAFQLQERLVESRLANHIPDTVLFLQHPPVLTLGVSGGEENIVVDRAMLSDDEVTVVQTDRGGNVAVHEPGQLVCYPILDLTKRGRDLHQYVRNIEEVVIRALCDYSIAAHRHPAYPGVWVGEEKICALGIRVTRWVTKHGFALNVNNGLKLFSFVNPCGIADGRVTSVSRLLGYKLNTEEVMKCLIRHFGQVFDIAVKLEPRENLCERYVI